MLRLKQAFVEHLLYAHMALCWGSGGVVHEPALEKLGVLSQGWMMGGAPEWGAGGGAHALASQAVTLVPPAGQVYSSRTPNTGPIRPCLSSRAADFSSKGPDCEVCLGDAALQLQQEWA